MLHLDKTVLTIPAEAITSEQLDFLKSFRAFSGEGTQSGGGRSLIENDHGLFRPAIRQAGWLPRDVIWLDDRREEKALPKP